MDDFAGAKLNVHMPLLVAARTLRSRRKCRCFPCWC